MTTLTMQDYRPSKPKIRRRNGNWTCARLTDLSVGVGMTPLGAYVAWAVRCNNLKVRMLQALAMPVVPKNAIH